MGKFQKLVAATSNEGKMKEFRALLEPYFSCVLSLKEVGIVLNVEENGNTFEENALIKANALRDVLDNEYAVIADDSGLCVDALGGAPGIYSARFAGIHGNDSLNNAKLLEVLGNCKDRNAKFVSAVALVGDFGAFVETGEVRGEILHAQAGANGFGYDPLFFCTEISKSFGEASQQEKNAVSHRARAIEKIVAKLENK